MSSPATDQLYCDMCLCLCSTVDGISSHKKLPLSSCCPQGRSVLGGRGTVALPALLWVQLLPHCPPKTAALEKWYMSSFQIPHLPITMDFVILMQHFYLPGHLCCPCSLSPRYNVHTLGFFFCFGNCPCRCLGSPGRTGGHSGSPAGSADPSSELGLAIGADPPGTVITL